MSYKYDKHYKASDLGGPELLSKEQLQKAAGISVNYTQLIRNLGVSDGSPARAKLKQKMIEFGIDSSHFIVGKVLLPEEEKIKKRKISQQRFSEKMSAQRKNPVFRAKFILQDLIREDKKEKFKDTDLTLEVVQELIANPCLYCGETELMMTLDRIDNSVGHVRKNVNPSCIRCNLLRRNMPYKAWIKLAPGVRKARETGKFGKWTGALW